MPLRPDPGAIRRADTKMKRFACRLRRRECKSRLQFKLLVLIVSLMSRNGQVVSRPRIIARPVKVRHQPSLEMIHP